MSNMGLVSIVVPVYGVEEYIEQCIDSLLSQRHRELEVILVNDGSQDRGGAICDLYAVRDRRLRVVHKTNGGLVSARKAGVEVATGQYLGFVDGDDWVGPDFVGSLHDCAASASADLVIAGHVREFLGKHEVIPPRASPGTYDHVSVLESLLPTAIYNGTFFQHGVSTYVWNKLFLRQQVTQFIRDVDEQIVMGEDAAITYPYLANCERVAVSRDAEYFYRQRSNSIVKSVSDINREYLRLSALFRYLRNRFAGSGNSADINEQLRYYFYAQVLVRSGAVIASELDADCMIPFPGLRPGQKVVVCSSGSFGQHVVGALRRLDRFDLVGWVDDDDLESQRLGLPVTSLDSVATLACDLIVIAAIDSEYGEALAVRLERAGIPRAKISLLAPDFGRLDAVLRSVGFDTNSFAYTPAL